MKTFHLCLFYLLLTFGACAQAPQDRPSGGALARRQRSRRPKPGRMQERRPCSSSQERGRPSQEAQRTEVERARRTSPEPKWRAHNERV